MRTLSAAYIAPSLSALVTRTVAIVSAVAATGSAEANVFGDHIAAACQRDQSPEAVEKHFKLFEATYKIETGDKSMPNPYRSAKSVISNAVALGIDLLDDDGMPKGKTQLQREIKDSKEPKSTDAKFTDGCSNLIKYMESGTMTMSKADATALLAQVVGVLNAAALK